MGADVRATGSQLNLDAVLDRCRRGDELAWESLVRSYQSRVYGLAYHYVANREDARDLAQDIFVKVYKNLRKCPNADNFLPWLFRIARNASIDHLRRTRARPPASQVSEMDMNSLVDQSSDPEEHWLKEARRGLFRKALQMLTRLNREIIILKEIQGLTLEEMARILNVPIGTLKSRSHRARLELAEKVLALSEVQGGTNS
jgi:RNA polymerase sigma-70 factor (ECF subfamily)